MVDFLSRERCYRSAKHYQTSPGAATKPAAVAAGDEIEVDMGVLGRLC
jgi:hypothetical protein